jgi:addiction module RelE/StbE family toxin
MIFKVKYSEQAAGDLADIIKYISDELCSPQASERFYKAVNEKLELLSEYPYIFPLHHDEKLSAEGYRFAVIGSYLMFYLVNENASVVYIARILYGKRDLLSSFRESTLSE